VFHHGAGLDQGEEMTSAILGMGMAVLSLLAAPQQVTFSETVAPIIYNNCVTCHRPGEAAPFPLISYDDVKKRGPLIAAVTKSRYMPPWHATHAFGEFKEERRLSDEQIATIGDWVAQGMPQGDPSKMPKLPVFTEGWHLGKPDLIVEMPTAYEVPASGPDIYRNFVVPTNLAEDRWIRSIEFRPSARKAVHHVLFGYDASGQARKLDGADGHPGYTTSMGGNFTNTANSASLGGWSVGNLPELLPEEFALSLPKGSDLVLQMHFHPTGKAEKEKSVVGIYFSSKPPERNLTGVELPPLFGFGAGINIPAGKSDYTIEDSLTLPVDTQAFGVFVHAHYVAKQIKATATLPDGTVQPLIWIQDWDFNWQDVYTFKNLVTLPSGTRVEVRVTYDNSAGNPANPNNPPKAVLWGEQTFDEMASVNIPMVTLRKEDEKTLQDFLSARQRAAIQRGVQDGTLKRMLEQRAK
jgi:mono/diheme cytochrome c family protein